MTGDYRGIPVLGVVAYGEEHQREEVSDNGVGNGVVNEVAKVVKCYLAACPWPLDHSRAPPEAMVLLLSICTIQPSTPT